MVAGRVEAEVLAGDCESAGSIPARLKGRTMEPIATITRHEALDHDELAVHNWRVSQLKRLGIPESLAEVYADRLDWHQVAHLVQRGCPVMLAVRIIR